MAGESHAVRLIQPGQLPEARPVFDRIAIIGLGLIGGSLALAARQVWPKALVIGVDDSGVLETAMRLHAVDVGAADLVVAAEADLVVLAAPVLENVRLVAELAEVVSGEAVITDVGGAKRSTMAAAAVLPESLTFIGGHPLAGAPRRGLEYARPDLFAGRPWILTPGAAPPAALGRLEQFVAAVGGVPQVMTAERHDHLMAYLSHLPQLVVSALMQIIGEEVGESGLALAGRGLLDTTRLASAPASTWQDVLAANADEVALALDALSDTLKLVRGQLERPEALEALFDSANDWRALMPSRSSPSAPAGL